MKKKNENLTMDPGELSPYAIDDPSVSVEAGLLLDEAARMPARSNP